MCYKEEEKRRKVNHYEQILLKRGSEYLNIPEDIILDIAGIFKKSFNDAGEPINNLIAIAQTLQMLDAGGLKEWFQTFLPDSILMERIAPVLLDNLAGVVIPKRKSKSIKFLISGIVGKI